MTYELTCCFGHQDSKPCGIFGILLQQFHILGDKVTVKIGKEGSKELMKKVLKKDQVRDYLYDYSFRLLNRHIHNWLAVPLRTRKR